MYKVTISKRMRRLKEALLEQSDQNILEENDDGNQFLRSISYQKIKLSLLPPLKLEEAWEWIDTQIDEESKNYNEYQDDGFANDFISRLSNITPAEKINIDIESNLTCMLYIAYILKEYDRRFQDKDLAAHITYQEKDHYFLCLTKYNFLKQQLKSNKISSEDYIQSLKNQIAHDLDLLVYFNKTDNVEMAAKVKQRIEIIQRNLYQTYNANDKILIENLDD